MATDIYKQQKLEILMALKKLGDKVMNNPVRLYIILYPAKYNINLIEA